MMDHRTWCRFAILVALALGGSATVFVCGCKNRANADRVLEVKKPPDHRLASNHTEEALVMRPAVVTLATAFDRMPSNPAPRKPVHALALSGGGQYAAFNAGMIVGWTGSGKRPVFDAVTGVSSGAMVALYAYLGPKYDPRLQYFFTTLQDEDIFQYRPIKELLKHGAIASPDRMKKLLETEIDDKIVADIQAAHKDGRRLFMATMNLKTRRVCIWDIGAIACSGRDDAKELVRKVMLAAAAIPGLLPAVKFDYEIDGERFTEEHVDGGASSQTFLRMGPGAARPTNDQPLWLKGSQLYAMAAGKLYPPLLKDDPGFLRRVTSTVSASLYALYRAELMGLYAYCLSSGMKFQMIAIPDDAEVPGNSMTFDPKAMKKLFALGYDLAKDGKIPWRLAPPGGLPGEEEPTRDATDLLPDRKSK